MNRTGVIFALIRDGKILMQQRDGNTDRFPFKWCIPGGEKEKDEEWEDTLLREVKEEYNLDIEINQCSYLMDYNEGVDKVYFCKIDSTQEPILQEGLAMKWMTIDEIEKIELGFHQNGIIPILKKMIF